MSLYYKNNKDYTTKNDPPQNHSKPVTTDSHLPPNRKDFPSIPPSKSPQSQSPSRQRVKSSGINAQLQLTHQFQNLDHISPKNGKPKSLSKEVQPHKEGIGKKKSPPKDKIKSKLSFIVQLFQEEESVAEVSSYHHEEEEDELDHSTSTIQSNQRHKYKQPQRNNADKKGIVQESKQFNKMKRNSKDRSQQVERDEFALQDKKKVEEKAKPKFLFYNLIKEQQALQQNEEPKDVQEIKYEKPVKKERKTLPIKLQPKRPHYTYEKGVHQRIEDKKDRLKNKIGFIFDIFHKDEEIASVSYYSQRQSQKQSVEEIPVKEPPPRTPAQNIFNQVENEFPQALPKQEKQEEKVQKNRSFEKSAAQSNEFEELNVPIKSTEMVKKINFDTSFANPKQPSNKNASVNSRHSPAPNKSLEKIELQMSLARKKKERQKLSITKSVDNKPKKTRYEDIEELQHLQMVSKQKKSEELSRFIKNSSMHESSKKQSQNQQPSGQEKLSKSRSEDSKFSVKMLQVSVKKSIGKQAQNVPKEHINESPSFMRIQSKQEEEIIQPTVKKTFPVARNVAQNRNGLFSKYMKIDYKQQGKKSNSDALDEELPTLINNTHQLPRPYLNQQKSNPAKTNANTGEETTKMSFKPVNKVEFNLEKSKRMRTEFIQQQPKEDLNEQQRKFLLLLRKREEALLKRVKEQALNNNPSSLLRDFQQRNKEPSNDTFEKLIAKEENNLSKIPSNYFHADRRQKMSFNTEQYELKSQFPTLNLSPHSKDANFQTFYNNPIKRSSSKNIQYHSKKKGYSEHLSSDSQKGKAFDERMQEVKMFKRQPSKISYYNIKKLQKDSSLKDRNFLNSKEKYERLKQLLEQI